MRPRPVPRSAAAAVAVALVALSACGGDEVQEVASGGGEAVASESPSVPPSETAAPTAGAGSGGASPSPGGEPAATPAPDEAPFVADTRPDTAESSGAGLSVTDVEIGAHEGYDRVVFTLGGQGEPGWRVEYVDTPTRQGSGEPFGVAGDAFLSVLLTGVGYPFDTGVEEYAGPKRLDGGGSRVVEEVAVGGVFEGQYDAAVGLSDRLPFRVFRLDGPPRVVLDVAHAG